VRFQFNVADTPIEFRRNWFSGKAELKVEGKLVPLQNPLAPTTHFSVSLKRCWRFEFADHQVVIEKERPLVLSGFRPQTYRVWVDDELLIERKGF